MSFWTPGARSWDNTDFGSNIDDAVKALLSQNALQLKGDIIGANQHGDKPYMIFFREGATKSSTSCSFSEGAALGYRAI